MRDNDSYSKGVLFRPEDDGPIVKQTTAADATPQDWAGVGITIAVTAALMALVGWGAIWLPGECASPNFKCGSDSAAFQFIAVCLPVPLAICIAYRVLGLILEWKMGPAAFSLKYEAKFNMLNRDMRGRLDGAIGILSTVVIGATVYSALNTHHLSASGIFIHSHPWTRPRLYTWNDVASVSQECVYEKPKNERGYWAEAIALRLKDGTAIPIGEQKLIKRLDPDYLELAHLLRGTKATFDITTDNGCNPRSLAAVG